MPNADSVNHNAKITKSHLIQLGQCNGQMSFIHIPPFKLFNIYHGIILFKTILQVCNKLFKDSLS